MTESPVGIADLQSSPSRNPRRALRREAALAKKRDARARRIARKLDAKRRDHDVYNFDALDDSPCLEISAKLAKRIFNIFFAERVMAVREELAGMTNEEPSAGDIWAWWDIENGPKAVLLLDPHDDWVSWRALEVSPPTPSAYDAGVHLEFPPSETVGPLCVSPRAVVESRPMLEGVYSMRLGRITARTLDALRVFAR